ncbi:single-stranded-DNA-specific exonuclease RecJ [Armatimonas rosea]|uniref:Single-stranded-DNA-specific exonuclease RecJ n=1 Tax=Armatimonas rosea TaxID=685828 RepID=A0A7W9W7W4_ARMRO|nr:single-stranded-DNA-specific exonuclease RecJ [Armatimonas rosea]MBB6052879.1 single-stranded-DNA-specific exonuclease RecJ [Armatimonas rosea]
MTSPTLLEAHWRLATPNESQVQRLAAELRLEPLVARLLINRGITEPGVAERYLAPRLDDLDDPTTLPDVEKAVERLAQAITSGELIFVHGDYDADGVTSAALCLRALSGLGANVVGFVPRRTDGYDFQPYGAEKAKELGAGLIMTADCGVCALEAVARANALGMDVIVTDHHRPGPTLPAAHAVVNPYRDDAQVAFRDLCGAGVAFKVLDALTARLKPEYQSAFRRNFVDLVALGTVSDASTLSGENRILVYHGLEMLALGRKTGLKALLSVAGLEGKELTAESIGFQLGPRLNAAGRMEDADLAYRLLITRDADEAEQLVAQIESLNDLRRSETERVVQEALAEALTQEDRRVLVLARARWGKGLVGIVAGRIAELLRRPTLILSYDETTDSYGGSGRTYGSFSLLDALHACADLLGRYGGHSASAGVNLPARNLEAFRQRIHEAAEGLVTDEPEPITLEIDAELADTRLLTQELVESLQALAPFGRDNPDPVFLTCNAVVTETRRVGKDNNTAIIHLKLPGKQWPTKSVRFKSGDWTERVQPGERVDVVYTPKLNAWNGKVSVELTLHDLRPSLP